MKDKQREVFTNLVQKELPDLIKNKSTMIADDLKLSFQLMDIDLEEEPEYFQETELSFLEEQKPEQILTRSVNSFILIR